MNHEHECYHEIKKILAASTSSNNDSRKKSTNAINEILTTITRTRQKIGENT